MFCFVLFWNVFVFISTALLERTIVIPNIQENLAFFETFCLFSRLRCQNKFWGFEMSLELWLLAIFDKIWLFWRIRVTKLWNGSEYDVTGQNISKIFRRLLLSGTKNLQRSCQDAAVWNLQNKTCENFSVKTQIMESLIEMEDFPGRWVTLARDNFEKKMLSLMRQQQTCVFKSDFGRS
jgi:hypothetical protein